MRRDYAIHETQLVDSPREAVLTIFEHPTDSEREHLVQQWKIPEQTIAWTLQRESLARVELDISHLVTILKTPHLEYSDKAFQLNISSVGLFLYESQLVIVTQEPLTDWLRNLKGIPMTPATLLIHAVSWIIEQYSICLAQINTCYDTLEAQFDRSPGNEYLRRLFLLEKSLVYFLNAINGNTFALERLRGFAKRFGCSHDELAYLDTVIAGNHQCQKQAEIYSNLLAGLVSARMTIVSNNLSALMKTLNLVTIGIMVPTFVVSIFSMNVAIPLQGSHHAFTIVLIMAIASAIGFAVLWRLASSRLSR